MELIIKTKNAKQEKSLLEFLQSKGITYSVSETATKKTTTKSNMQKFIESASGVIKKLPKEFDYEQERYKHLIEKHK